MRERKFSQIFQDKRERLKDVEKRRDKRYEGEIKKEGCKEGSNLQRIRLFQAFSKQTGAKFARNKRHDSSGGGLGRVASRRVDNGVHYATRTSVLPLVCSCNFRAVLYISRSKY